MPKEAFGHLKRQIDGATVSVEERQALQSGRKAAEKEASKLQFQLDRALREKRTLSTLLARTTEDLEKSTELIKKMFGRYLSTEIMNTLLDDPSALALERYDSPLRTLVRPIPVSCITLGDGTEAIPHLHGEITRLSVNEAGVRLNQPVDEMINVKMKLDRMDQRIASSRFYGKVIESRDRPDSTCRLRFTSLPPEVNAYFQAHLELAGD